MKVGGQAVTVQLVLTAQWALLSNECHSEDGRGRVFVEVPKQLPFQLCPSDEVGLESQVFWAQRVNVGQTTHKGSQAAIEDFSVVEQCVFVPGWAYWLVLLYGVFDG